MNVSLRTIYLEIDLQEVQRYRSCSKEKYSNSTLFTDVFKISQARYSNVKPNVMSMRFIYFSTCRRSQQLHTEVRRSK